VAYSKNRKHYTASMLTANRNIVVEMAKQGRK
jgi:hypothetical protein